MSNLSFYRVNIPVDTESSLYTRIVDSAQKRNISIETVIQEVATIGIWRLMEDNLRYVNMAYENGFK